MMETLFAVPSQVQLLMETVAGGMARTGKTHQPRWSPLTCWQPFLQPTPTILVVVAGACPYLHQVCNASAAASDICADTTQSPVLSMLLDMLVQQLVLDNSQSNAIRIVCNTDGCWKQIARRWCVCTRDA